MAYFCAIDPGFKGGIGFVSSDPSKDPVVYKMPVIETTTTVKGRKKTKKVYDVLEIRKVFLEHLDKDSVIVLERVASMPNEGSVSSFNFGKGFGELRGIIVGLFNKEPEMVTPQSWKKEYPELITDEMRDIKDEMKALRYEAKKIEGKEDKKENKKHVDKLGRKFKSLAKTEARKHASKLFPILSDKFVRVNTDGMAESVLIALYGKNKFA